jgi:hypothetical protein
MPHLVKWNEDYSDFGLVVIGLHAQNVGADDLKAACRALGVRFPVVQGGAVGGDGGGGIPHCYLFDHAGACVYEGHPDKVEGKLRPAIGAALTAGISDPPKSIATVADALKKGGSPIDALKKLNALKGDSDKKVSEPAKAIIGKITEVAQKRLDEAKAAAKDDPIAAYDLAALTLTRWKGLSLGMQANELVGKLKQEKVVVAELKARPTLETLRKLDTLVSARLKDDTDLKSAEFKKAFAPQLKQMTQAYNTLVKVHPDAPATKAAEEFAKKYDLKAK